MKVFIIAVLCLGKLNHESVYFLYMIFDNHLFLRMYNYCAVHFLTEVKAFIRAKRVNKNKYKC